MLYRENIIPAVCNCTGRGGVSGIYILYTQTPSRHAHKYGQSNDKLSLTAQRLDGAGHPLSHSFVAARSICVVGRCCERCDIHYHTVLLPYRVLSRDAIYFVFYLTWIWLHFLSIIQIGCLISFNKLNISTNLQHDIVTILDIAVS